MWDMYHDQADVLLSEYWRVCEELAWERESIRRYEKDNQFADILAMSEIAFSHEPKTKANTPKVILNLKKKPRKASRKSRTPSWVQFPQLNCKTSRHSPNPKPLMKLTRAALSVSIKKF